MRKILFEGKEISRLADSFVRSNPNIDRDGLITLMMADPTAVKNDRGSFAGRYATWIGNLYAKGLIKPGDTPELKRALITYDKNKSQLPPIKDISSLLDLMRMVKKYRDDFKPARRISKGEQELEKVYEDDEWVVYIPHTYRASRKIGGDTKWCTASSDPDYFEDYSSQGPLYVNIRKSDGKKFQFHFATRQFMDDGDNPITLNKIGLSKGLVDFYCKIYPHFKPMATYDWISEDVNDGFALIINNHKYNYISHDEKLLSPNQWFDHAWYFKNGFAVVNLDGKSNYINTDGKLLSPNLWFDNCWNFDDGFAIVKLKYKWNAINTKGELISPNQWFDDINFCYDDAILVELKGKWNLISTTNNNLLFPNQWFDYVDVNCINGWIKVIVNDKRNFINTKGKLLSPNQWFDYATDFDSKDAQVILNDKLYLLDKNGKLYDANTKLSIDSLQEYKMDKKSLALLNEELSNNLLSAISKNLTSLGDNPSIPHIPDNSFLDIVLHSEYDSVLKDMESLFGENMPSTSQMEGMLSRIVSKCQEIERPYRNELELICGNKLAELFDIPQDSVNISLALVDEITVDTDSVIVDPVDGDQYLQFTNIDSDAEILRKEVYKRRFLDMLCTGAGLSFSSVIKSFAEDIYDLNPQLLDLYEKFITINSYLLLSKDDIGINDDDNKLIGFNTVRLGGKDEVVSIKAQGKIFPVLYAEAIKGFMELFASHGLPKDTELAKDVIGKSDFIKAEPWDMRFGPLIWKSLYIAIMGDDEDTTLLPYLFQAISRLEPDSFSRFMVNTLMRTRQSQRWIEKIRMMAIKNKQNDDFGQKIEKSRQKSLISDDIYSQEL